VELLEEVLVKILADEEKIIIFPNIKVEISEIIEMKCYRALQKN